MAIGAPKEHIESVFLRRGQLVNECNLQNYYSLLLYIDIY